MRAEVERWMKEAEADLKASKDSLNAGNHNWSCFQAQQSAEKALKAFLYNKGYTSIITHSLKELVQEASKLGNFSEVRDKARFLDMFYVPTRYPNALAGNLAPSEFYEREDAEKCLNSAESILMIVNGFLKR